MLALTSHIYSSIQAYTEKENETRFLWSYLNLSSKYGVKHRGLGHNLKPAGHSILRALGLCVWAVVGQTDAQSMINCSIEEWLERTYATAEHAAFIARDSAQGLYDDVAESITQVKDEMMFEGGKRRV